MNNTVLNKGTTSTQRFWLAYEACQWWNVVFVQAIRFFDALEQSHGGEPWADNDKSSMFVADRLFLIVAIFNAIEFLKKLHKELSLAGDNSLQVVFDSIEEVASLEDLKNLRDMNIHGLDYLLGVGHKEEQFRSTIVKGDYEILTTAAWTHIHGDLKIMLLGNVEIDKLLIVMKAQLPFVHSKTKEVYDNATLQT